MKNLSSASATGHWCGQIFGKAPTSGAGRGTVSRIILLPAVQEGEASKTMSTSTQILKRICDDVRRCINTP